MHLEDDLRELLGVSVDVVSVGGLPRVTTTSAVRPILSDAARSFGC